MEMTHSQSNDRILQRFEWTWDNREIRLDGRKPANVDDYLPRFTGYSTAKWEGDTLVVTSTGFDDRQWVDQYGYPISEKAILEERWERPTPNRLRVQMTLTDPVNYTRPWQSSLKVWTLIPKDKMSVGGWSASSRIAACRATSRVSISSAITRPVSDARLRKSNERSAASLVAGV